MSVPAPQEPQQDKPQEPQQDKRQEPQQDKRQEPQQDKRNSDPYIVVAGLVVVLAVVGVVGLAVFLVVRFSGNAPAVAAAVLAAFATVLAAVPPIIKALRGG